MIVWVNTILKLIALVSFYPFKGATRMFKIVCCGSHYISISQHCPGGRGHPRRAGLSQPQNLRTHPQDLRLTGSRIK